MSDAPPPSPPNVAALVDAIDVRAKQAGAEGATEVMQRLLGSVTDVLTSIADRLDHVEEALHDEARGGATSSVLDAVQNGLASFNARLGRLEEAFVQAVDDSGSGTQAVVDEVRAVVTRALEDVVPPAPPPAPEVPPFDPETRDALARVESALGALERRLEESSRPRPGTSLEEVFELVQTRLAGLEQLVRTQASTRQDSATEVRAAIAPTTERLQGVETALSASKDQLARVDAALAAMPGRFASIEERVTAVASSLTGGGAGGAVDDDVLSRLEDAVERLDRDEASARLVRLVEERLSAGLRAVTERTDEVRRSLEAFVSSAAATANRSSAGADEVRSRVDALTNEVRALTTLPDAVSTALAARLGPLADRVGGLDARLDGLDARVAGIDDTVGQLHTSLDSIAAMRLRLDEVAARPAPDLSALSKLSALSAITDLREADSALTASLASLREDVTRRLDELAATSAAAEGRGDDDVTVAIAALSSSLESRLEPLASNEEVTDAIEAMRRELERRLDALAASLPTEAPAPPPPPAPAATGDPETRAAIVALTSSLADRFEELERRLGQTGPVEDLVRRETELLTQRVAALAVGVEATRALLEQQQLDAENRIGRKAGEVTRRLAADFGIRTGRSAPGGGRRRDPRELGPPPGDRSS